MSTKKVVVCFSGGLDSTVLLYHYLNYGYDVYPLSVNYGQRHKRELDAAWSILHHLDPTYKTVAGRWRLLPLGFFAEQVMYGSSQTSDRVPVPEGHYAEESMKATVVPNRNMVLLSLATAYAVSVKAEFVGYAAHAGDRAIYPDCRVDFVGAMIEAIRLCDWNPPALVAPFVSVNKSGVVRLGAKLNVPFAMTYSCYKGGEKHCGKCGTCTERKEAFQLAGVPDPTEYEG